MADPATADAAVAGPATRSPSRTRRRQRRRRRTVAAVAGGAVLLAGVGTAWAMSGGDATRYRFATVTRSDIEQTVDADGALAATDNGALAFAVAGTVATVDVAVGDTVTAGQKLATLDTDDLETAVTSARTALAQAKEQLASDREAQADGTTVSSSNGGSTGQSTGQSTTQSSTRSSASGDTASYTALLAAKTGTTKTSTTKTSTTKKTGTTKQSGSAPAVSTAQQKVITAQHALDTALRTQDAAIGTLVTACAPSDETTPTTATVTADTNGTVSGTLGSSPAAVTLRTTDGDVADTSASNPQRVAAAGTWRFTGLDAGTTYRVEIARTATIDSDDCLAAVKDVSAGRKTLDGASRTLTSALTALTSAVANSTTATPSGGGTSANSSGSAPSAPTSGKTQSGSTSGGTSGTAPSGSSTSDGGVLVTAQRIAADVKTVDAKAAALTSAKQSLSYATLTSTIDGTVAAVDLAKGDSVSAGSSSSTITVVGTGELSVTVDVALADIDLIKVGQSASVTVDGRTDPVPAKVSFVGPENTASGSSASYPVTVTLQRKYASLYDGMGAGVAIDVGTADDVLTVPISAVSRTARSSTVRVRDGSTVTTTSVKVGLIGDDRVELTSGVKAGQQVVLAEVSAAVPSGDSNTRTGRSGLSNFSGAGGTGGTGGGPPGR